MVSLVVASSTGGGCSSSSSVSSTARARIACQSSVAARTWSSTFSMLRRSSSSSSRSCSRPTSAWRIDSGIVPSSVGVRVEDVDDLTVLVAADPHHRVDHQVDAVALAGQVHRHRVDDERHVVGDDLDHACAATATRAARSPGCRPAPWPRPARGAGPGSSAPPPPRTGPAGCGRPDPRPAPTGSTAARTPHTAAAGPPAAALVSVRRPCRSARTRDLPPLPPCSRPPPLCALLVVIALASAAPRWRSVLADRSRAPRGNPVCGALQRAAIAGARSIRCRTRTYVRMTSDGNPYARFRRALETGNETLVVAGRARAAPGLAGRRPADLPGPAGRRPGALRARRRAVAGPVRARGARSDDRGPATGRAGARRPAGAGRRGDGAPAASVRGARGRRERVAGLRHLHDTTTAPPVVGPSRRRS